MDERTQRRIAENESRFRDANERLESELRGFGGESRDRDRYELVCECALDACDGMVAVTGREYEHVRSNPVWFLVRPEHVVESVERTVERTDRYWIIEKRSAGADEARERDPRQ